MNETGLRTERVKIAPMSFAEERLWNFIGAAGSSDEDTLPLSDHLYGPLDVDILRDCLSGIVRRHEILRTTFGVENSHPVRIIHPPAPVDLPVFNLTDSEDPENEAIRILAKEASSVADMAAGPLIRFALIRFAPDRHRLIRPCHHIIWDPVSSRVFLRDLTILYEARRNGRPSPLPETEPFQFADYAERERLAAEPGPTFERDVAWWRDRIEWKRILGWGPRRRLPSFPFARPTPEASARVEDGWITQTIEPDMVDALDRLKREMGATLYVVWLAAIVALLARDCADTDVVIGAYVTTRRRAAMRNLIGFCSNLVTLRFRCDFALSFSDWLAIVGREVAEADSRSHISYERLRDELSIRGARIMPVRLIFDAPLGFARDTLHFGGLTIASAGEPPSKTMPWGCTLLLDRRDGVQFFLAKFDARIYDPAGVNGFLGRLLALLREAASAPRASLATIMRS